MSSRRARGPDVWTTTLVAFDTEGNPRAPTVRVSFPGAVAVYSAVQPDTAFPPRFPTVPRPSVVPQRGIQEVFRFPEAPNPRAVNEAEVPGSRNTGPGQGWISIRTRGSLPGEPGRKDAETHLSPSMRRAQIDVVPQEAASPDQLSKRHPGSGYATSVTRAPRSNWAEQVRLDPPGLGNQQLIPGGKLTTCPFPPVWLKSS